MTNFPTTLPKSRVPDSRQVPVLSWGLVGPGWIAERFVAALQTETDQKIVAVCSRSLERGRAFAKRWNIPTVHADVEALVADPEVDVVYVATPHNHHFSVAMAVLEGGKHALVEKPLALNAVEGQVLCETARRSGVLLVEALWTAFLPKFDVLRQVLADGILGTVHTVIADHGEYFEADHRIMRADLAGGPMLDLGVYTVALSTMVLGEARHVQAAGQLASSGVNGQVAMTIDHVRGGMSQLHCTLFGHTPCGATLSGNQGMLTFPGKFYAPGPFTIIANDLTRRLVHEEDAIGYRGLRHQIAHVATCIENGEVESPIHPHANTLATLRSMDRARAAIGIVFAEERGAMASNLI